MMEFTKIQGTGNDFIIIDNRKYSLTIEEISALAKNICRRKYSIGADGLISIEYPSKNTDFKMNFFNSDGSMAEMCGNGARCAARYVYENKKLSDLRKNQSELQEILNTLQTNHCEKMLIEAGSGIVPAWRIDKRRYKISLNNPTLINLENKINIDGTEIDYSYVELGNPGLPHVAIRYKNLINVKNCDIVDLARKIRENKIFNKGSNVSFYDIIDDYSEFPVSKEAHEQVAVILRTYERGVENFTLACGTAAGAVATVITLKNKISQNNIRLISEGGELNVEINKTDENIIEDIFLIGDTNIVAIGKIIDEDLEEKTWIK